MVEHISSLNNRIVKMASSLSRKSARIKEGLFLLEGDSVVIEAYKSNIELEYIFINENSDITVESLNVFAKNTIYASDAVMNKISELDTAPPVIACGVYVIPDIENIKKGRYILLENIQDPGNMGAIIRSAAAFGIDGVVVCGGCDIFSGKVIRGSMGACFNMPVFVFDNVNLAINSLHKKGNKIYAAILNSTAKKISEYRLGEGSCIAIGNEGNGLSYGFVNSCDGNLYIPITNKAESLNAAVAASICMWEMIR